jgi:carbonic anhydrase
LIDPDQIFVSFHKVPIPKRPDPFGDTNPSDLQLVSGVSTPEFRPCRKGDRVFSRIQLAKGLHNFRPDDFGTLKDLKKTSCDGDHVLLICCSDIGFAADNLSVISHEQCTVVQNMGGVIPSVDRMTEASTIASIAFGMSRHRIRDIVVCGHLGCRVLRHWLKSPSTATDRVSAERFTKQVCFAVDDQDPCQSQAERWARMTCEHTLFQLDNLCSHEFIKCQLRSGSIRLHAWILDDSTAIASVYDPWKCGFYSGLVAC